MQVENAMPMQIAELEKIVEGMKEQNPEITATSMTMKELDVLKRLDAIEAKVDRIINKLQLIFGDHVLINGNFNNTIRIVSDGTLK